MAVKLDAVFDALLDVEADWRTGEHDRDDIVELWLGLSHLRSILGDLVKTVGDDAASRLLDRDDPSADHETRSGEVVHLGAGYAAERWRGHDVLAELAAPMVPVDLETGELGSVEQCVPIAVLVDVLPGCATPELTSSHWRTTGLRRHLPDWYRYRSRDEAPLVVKRGARRMP